MSDLKMHTANLVAKNIEKLTALFPNCITETRNEQGESKAWILIYYDKSFQRC